MPPVKAFRLCVAAVALTLSSNGMAISDDSYVECVPIARQISGIQIYGDARTWWHQAEGRYARGVSPRTGAVLSFKPYGAMRLGHVAAVSKIIDDRTILVTHANWSLIDGRRGQIERNVRVVDVSDAGDWSRVRVWYAPLDGLGTTLWPVEGFIYPSAATPEPDRAGPPKAPKLDYASVLKLEPIRRNAAMADATPTGRLAYLGKALTRMK